MLKIIKIYARRYKVVFTGSLNELVDFLNIVMNDDCVEFNMMSGFWEIQEESLNYFLSKYPNLSIPIEHKKVKIKKYDKALEDIGSTMKLKPYYYQKEAIKFALDKQNALIILPCGSGKKHKVPGNNII